MAYFNLRGPVSGSLFIHRNGLPLTRQLLSVFLKEVTSAAGILGTFSGHSFRIGAATFAAQQGIPDDLIKTLGHWSSDAYQLYVRTPIEPQVFGCRGRGSRSPQPQAPLFPGSPVCSEDSTIRHGTGAHGSVVGIASHGSSTLSGGRLVGCPVEALESPRHPTST